MTFCQYLSSEVEIIYSHDILIIIIKSGIGENSVDPFVCMLNGSLSFGGSITERSAAS